MAAFSEWTQDQSFLVGAVSKQDASTVKSVLAKKDFSEFILNENLLHIAAEVGNLEILKFLLDKVGKSFIDQFDDMSKTPLIIAADKGHLNIVKYLVSGGAEINARQEGKIGNTVLREIIETADYEMIRFLLENGANPCIKGWMQLDSADQALKRYERDENNESKKILEAVTQYAKKFNIQN